MSGKSELPSNRFHALSEDDWAEKFVMILSRAIHDCKEAFGRCNVMLTGGRSAEKLYTTWADRPAAEELIDVDFYFGDERCVTPEHSESNYGLVLRTLFKAGVREGSTVHRMEAEREDIEKAASGYAEILPEHIDILLLSMGEDGHIASLFPHSSALQERRRTVLPVTHPMTTQKRLTITPLVIQSAKQIFVMACSNSKFEFLSQLNLKPNDYLTIPARLALRGEWVTHP